MISNRDDWDGPIPIERHPMLSPEVRLRLAEMLRKNKIEIEERRLATRKKLVRCCVLLLLVTLGAFKCWTY